MEKYKEIYNLNTEDLNIIKEFIDLYEQTENQYKKYGLLCESISKNMIYQKYGKDSIKIIENCIFIIKKLTEEINTTSDEYRKKLLTEQKKNITKQIEQMEKYKEIEKEFMNMYYGNLQDYFESEIEEEKETKIYNIKDELQEKEYYYNKKSTITQIYTRLRYLYNFYREYYVNKKDINIDFEFLKNNLKFYQIFKEAIKKYTEDNKKRITQIIDELSEENREYIQKIK